MTESVMFLVDLGLLVVVGGIALVAPGQVGSWLAAGLYVLLTGVGLLLLPTMSWDVARTDNAFLGLYLIAFLALMLGIALTLRAVIRLRAEPGSRTLPAVLVALVAAALAVGLLAIRGPGAWATGSGQFGVDVIATDVVLGLATYLAGRRLSAGDVRRSRPAG